MPELPRSGSWISRPDTLRAHANLASSYWSAGRVSEAILIEEQVFADRKRILGPGHPETIQARVNLALSYWSTERRDEAIDLQEQALAESERVLGAEHPSTVARRNVLGAWTGAE